MRRGKVIGFLAILFLFLFIISSMNALAAFNPRNAAPDGSDYRYYSSQNPYYYLNGVPRKNNCTTYAFGRAWEIIGSKPNLQFSGNAGVWFDINTRENRYSSGDAPKLGAIACWKAPNSDMGHVAVVENISGNTVTFSNSEYNGKIFGTISRERTDMYYGHYVFKGYIYMPGTEYNDTIPPVVSNIRVSDINRDGYTVTCDVSNNSGIKEVKFPTWFQNQQGSDAKWLQGTVNGNTASVRVNINDWGGMEGYYHTHVYAYDLSGNYSQGTAESNFIDRTVPKISNVRIENIDSTGYTIVCNVNDNTGIDRVQFPTWSIYGNQDDIMENWPVNPAASGIRDGDTVRYRVEDSDHYYRRGYYYTHIYASDNWGNQSCYEMDGFNFQNTYKVKKYIDYNGHRYSLYEDILDWKQAEAKCKALGGHLATITSEGEERAIESLLDGNIKRIGYFLGGTDNGSKGSFRWITGEKFGYVKWNTNQPDNYKGDEDYIEILREQKSWNDVNLNDFGNLGRGFILETTAVYNVTSINLSNTSIKLNKKGEQQTIKATISPANATNKKLTWKSSNPSVATVDQNGKVTAVSNGTANITVTTQDGNKTATCKVTVNIPKPVTPDKPSVSATSIKLNKPSLTLYKGKTYTLKATVKPKTYNSGIKWSSSASKYATVSSKGKITAKKSGRTVITAQTKNGKKATCIIKVKERKATKVKLSRKNLTLKVGRKYALKATVYPKNTTDTKKWTINKKGIVKVSRKGVVTGLKKGKCRITLKTSSGKSAYCNVKVE